MLITSPYVRRRSLSNPGPARRLPDSVTPKIVLGNGQGEFRECETCGRRFRPWRPQALHCSGARRQKAYRERSRKLKAARRGTSSALAGRAGPAFPSRTAKGKREQTQNAKTKALSDCHMFRGRLLDAAIATKCTAIIPQ
jgi:hypothetical protein